MNYEYITRLQERLSKEIIKHDTFSDDEIEHIAGVDVSYSKDKAYPCMVIIDRKTLDMIDYKCKEFKIDAPYIPTLLFLREGNAMLSILRDGRYDLIMVDGNGILHPRRFGLACYIGSMLDKPTIGVAKRLLCGNVSGDLVIDNNEVIGKMVISNTRRLYVSIGNKISLDTAVRIVKEVCRYSIPEPIRLADMIAKRYARGYA